MTDERKQRTLQQNKALWLWNDQVAQALNDAGIGMKAVLEIKEVDVPWSKDRVMEVLFRPIYEAMTDKESTTEADTVEFDRVVNVLVRHLGDKLGITLPAWPDRFNQGQP